MRECECWLAKFSPRECRRPNGTLLWRVHLLPKQKLRQAGFDPWDLRSFVWACGDSSGLGGCHELLDRGDLRVPFDELPGEMLDLAREAELIGWALNRYRAPA